MSFVVKYTPKKKMKEKNRNRFGMLMMIDIRNDGNAVPPCARRIQWFCQALMQFICRGGISYMKPFSMFPIHGCIVQEKKMRFS